MALPSSESAMKQWHIPRDPLTTMHLNTGNDLEKMVGYYFHDMPPELQAELSKRIESISAQDNAIRNAVGDFQLNKARYAHKMAEARNQLLEMAQAEDMYTEYQQSQSVGYQPSEKSQKAYENEEAQREEEEESDEESERASDSPLNPANAIKPWKWTSWGVGGVLSLCLVSAPFAGQKNPEDAQVEKALQESKNTVEALKENPNATKGVQKLVRESNAPNAVE